MTASIKQQPRNGRPPVPPRPDSLRTKDFVDQIQYDINGIYYTPSTNESIYTCICRCLDLSIEHKRPVDVKFNGVTLVIDNKQSPLYSYWKGKYESEIFFDKAPLPPFTPVKEERPPTTEYHGNKKPPFPVACSRCGKEWRTCKHSDGSRAEREMDDNTMWFFFGCLVGLFASYIFVTF